MYNPSASRPQHPVTAASPLASTALKGENTVPTPGAKVLNFRNRWKPSVRFWLPLAPSFYNLCPGQHPAGAESANVKWKPGTLMPIVD